LPRAREELLATKLFLIPIDSDLRTTLGELPKNAPGRDP
jgi:hypothetical protein